MYRLAWVLDDLDDYIGLFWMAIPPLCRWVWFITAVVFSFVIAVSGLEGLVWCTASAGLILALLLRLSAATQTLAAAGDNAS